MHDLSSRLTGGGLPSRGEDHLKAAVPGRARQQAGASGSQDRRRRGRRRYDGTVSPGTENSRRTLNIEGIGAG